MNAKYLIGQTRQFLAASCFALAIVSAITVNNSFDNSYAIQEDLIEKDSTQKVEGQQLAKIDAQLKTAKVVIN